MSGSLSPTAAAPGGASPGIDGPVDIPARSVLVLGEAELTAPAAMRKGGSDTLDRLAEAAGIAGEWEGADHALRTVSDGTKRALRAALGRPAASNVDARQTLAQLVDERDRRPLPFTLTFWA